MTYKMTVLALGAGVQSSTILLMACKGELPKPDLAIFADTGWESLGTYKHLEWLKQETGKAGIPILHVGSANIKDDLLNNDFIRIPFYCRKGDLTLMGRRRCTEYYKLRPIRYELRRLLGYRPRQRISKGAVDLWIGISIDEAQRAHMSPEQFIDKSYPLLTIKPMTRIQCVSWLDANYPNQNIPKSSCVGCPFHSDREWQRVKQTDNEWENATQVDSQIRHREDVLKLKRYLHRLCKPLVDIDLRTPQEKGQLEFDFGKTERLQLFGNLEI